MAQEAAVRRRKEDIDLLLNGSGIHPTNFLAIILLPTFLILRFMPLSPYGRLWGAVRNGERPLPRGCRDEIGKPRVMPPYWMCKGRRVN